MDKGQTAIIDLNFEKEDFEVAFAAMRKAQEPPLFAMPSQEKLFMVGFKAMMTAYAQKVITE